MLLELVVDSMQRCSHPQAEEGHQVREGCLQRTCKHGTWRSFLVSNKCCYQGEAYSINTTIYSTMSEDGCAKTAIDCVEETPGDAKTVLSVKNYCDYATKDQAEDIKKILAEQIDGGSGCHGEKMEAKVNTKEPKVLLFGAYSEYQEKLEVLSLPDLTPLDCNIPAFPGLYKVLESGWWGYVGRSTSDGVLMCGGQTNDGFSSSCYLLTRSGYQEMPGLMQERSDAASVVTPLGLWVTGGYDYTYLDTTEIWSNNQSRPHVRLPEGVSGHCLTPLNTTHVLLTGGETDPYSLSSGAFIYNEEEGFTRIEDMSIGRKYHGCSVIDDSTVLVAGGDTGKGRSSSSEYLDLTSLTWSPGPELPQDWGMAQMFGPEELGPEIGGHLLIGGFNIFKLEEGGSAQKRHWTHIKETENDPYQWAFVVNQNMFC